MDPEHFNQASAQPTCSEEWHRLAEQLSDPHAMTHMLSAAARFLCCWGL